MRRTDGIGVEQLPGGHMAGVVLLLQVLAMPLLPTL